MDQSTLVDVQIEDGRRLVEQFAADGNDVRAAFWAKTTEEGIWFLYVVTELVENSGPAAAYRAIHAAFSKLADMALSSSEVKVIGPNNRIAKDLMAIMSRHKAPLDTRIGETVLGFLAIEQGFVYDARRFRFTQANPMTSDEIMREIARLMNRGPGHLQPSTIQLNDGTVFSGVPFSLDLGTNQETIVKFIAEREPAPRVVRLADISSIR